jgi:hypothetical protein
MNTDQSDIGAEIRVHPIDLWFSSLDQSKPTTIN